jgi:hypothetical protein
VKEGSWTKVAECPFTDEEEVNGLDIYRQTDRQQMCRQNEVMHRTANQVEVTQVDAQAPRA